MDQYSTNTDLVKNAHLFDKCGRLNRIGKHFAASLDDEDLSFKQPDVGRRVFERRHDNCAISFRGQGFAPSI
jgi:hypothetical protein